MVKIRRGKGGRGEGGKGGRGGGGIEKTFNPFLFFFSSFYLFILAGVGGDGRCLKTSISITES